MFQSIIRRAESAIDRSIDHAISRAVMVVPFVIAGGFATAALSQRLTLEFGPETGYWLMAGVFTVLGALTAAIVLARSPAAKGEAEPGEEQPSEAAATADEQSILPEFGEAEREMVMSALTTMAPIALPAVLRMLVKNLPIIAVLAAALFVAMRQSAEPVEPSVSPEPAA
jgi:hypothetical protein